MNNNLNAIREKMSEKNIDALFLQTNEHRLSRNIFYLSGFSGEDGFLIITKDEAILLVDGRYPEQAREEAKDGIEVRLHKRPMIENMTNILGGLTIKNVGLEEAILSHAFYKSFTSELSNIEPIKADGIVEELRIIKSNEEIEYLRNACKCSDDAFKATLEHMKVGATERDIATELEYQMKRRGASKASFPIIVASGFRGAMAHGLASDKKLENGDFVVIDFGATVDFYNSDCTRTIVVGEPTQKHKEIYDTVRNSQENAMHFFKPGEMCKTPDLVAREIIEKAGYGENFNHSLGHGIGLDVHEAPGISYLSPDENILKTGMIASNEPGIYLEGWGGVRIEDTVVVRENGGEPLTLLTKDMIVVE